MLGLDELLYAAGDTGLELAEDPVEKE